MSQESNNRSARKRPSLREVAARANISVATVSRVLNNSGYIAAETRTRVLKAAAELNYHPNLRAKGLRQQRSRTIGLLIPNLLNAYYTALADDVSQRLNAAGYQLLLSSTRDDAAVERAALRQLIGHDVDGLIWVPSAADCALLEDLRQQDLPAVSIVRRVDGDCLDTVIFEDFAGAHAAIQHLLGQGHRRIGYIGGDVVYSSNRERLQGFQQALLEAGLAADPSLLKLGALRVSWGAAAVDELLRLDPPPSAVFCASNALLPGVLRSLHEHGIRVPGEMSLVCFDDLDWFSFFTPPISAISTSPGRMAQAAVDLLLRRIEAVGEEERTPELIRLSFELLLRGSTSAPGASIRE